MRVEVEASSKIKTLHAQMTELETSIISVAPRFLHVGSEGGEEDDIKKRGTDTINRSNGKGRPGQNWL